MLNAPDEVISTVDRSTLTPIVRQALDDATAEVIDWGYHTLQQVTEVEERAAREDVTFEVEGRLAEAVAELLRSLESECPLPARNEAFFGLPVTADRERKRFRGRSF